MAAKVFQTGLLTDPPPPTSAGAGSRSAASTASERPPRWPGPASEVVDRSAGRGRRAGGRVWRPPRPDGRIEPSPPTRWSSPSPTTPSTNSCPRAPSPTRPRSASSGVSPVVNVHVRLRPTGHRPAARRRPSTARSSGSSTAPPRPGWTSAGSAGQQYLAVSLSAADAYLGRRPDDLGGHDRRRPGRPAPRGPRRQRARHAGDQGAHRHLPGRARHRARCGPDRRTHVPGLALAGAWTDTGWPATMEGRGAQRRRRGTRRSGRLPARTRRLPEEVA